MIKLKFPRSNKHNQGFIIGSLFKTYREYLESDLWLEKRGYFLKKYPTCFKCGKIAQCVHHLTYEHVTNEKEEDLMSLCMKCHDKIHGVKY